VFGKKKSRTSRKYCSVFVFGIACLLLFLNHAVANDVPGTNRVGTLPRIYGEAAVKSFIETGYNTGKIIDTAQDRTSTRLVSIAQWVDSFFDDPEYVEEEADARASVRQSVRFYRDLDPEYRTRVRASVVLPNLSRRFRLSFEGNDELYGDDSAAVEDNLAESTRESVDQPSLRLQYLFLQRSDADLGLSGGVRLSDRSFYAGPRLKVSTDLGAGWESRFTQRVLWYTTNELRSKSEIRFDHLLGKRNLFRQAFRTDWDSAKHEFEGFHNTATTSITQPFGKNVAFRYAWSSLYLTRPDPRWTATTLTVGYRQSVLCDWLVLEIAPFVTWEELYDWDAGAGVVLSLNIIFDDE